MGVTDPYGYSDEPAEDAGQATGVAVVSRFLNWVGAITSVALLAGLVLWGYKLTVRDVTGVPVVRALEGPMRVQPEDPGGTQAAYQGLAVNAVQADGVAAAPPERLVLAPQPVELTRANALPPVSETEAASDTATAADTAASPAGAGAQTPLAEQGATVAETTAPKAPPADPAPSDPVLAALQGAQRAVQAATSAKGAEAGADGRISTSTPGVSRSPRPKNRPDAEIVAKASKGAIAVSATAASIDVDAATLAKGTRLVQLGAFDNDALARAEWDRLASRFGAYMVDKKRVIQKAQSAGRSFYRLRAMGFADINDARRFCSALLAENAACIPVVTR